MRILVLGASGTLGHQLCKELSDGLEVWGTFRSDTGMAKEYGFLPESNAISNVDVRDIAKVKEIIDSVKPDVLVNGVGVIKQRDEAKKAIPSIHINALFPHQLSDICAERGIRLILISTDCVFSGMRGNYTEFDLPDPVDLYGRTKLLGEVNRPGCLTLRTSIIGWQLNGFSNLLSWFALQRGKEIKGYRKAIYSGFSTSVLGQLIGDILKTRSDLAGLYQIASEPISKYDLLVQLRDELDWQDITIEPDDQFFCDRSLSGARFSSITGWFPPTWESMLRGLAKEWPQYANLYSRQ